jgi:predicted ATPase
MLGCEAMPYITRIRIDQCRNVRDLDIDLSVPAENGAGKHGPRFRHVILTGPNGSGKSGVLEAVALFWREVVLGVRTPDAPRTRLAWAPADDPQAAFHLGQHVAVYLAARRQVAYEPVAGPRDIGLSYRNLAAHASVSQLFVQFLVNKRVEGLLAAGEGDPGTASRLQEWFERFEHSLRWLFEDDRLALEFDRRAFKFTLRTGDGYAFDLATLADGHAAVMAILAELFIRIETVQHARGDFTFEPDGVVIVDEIETHLHLSLQEQILPLLTELFPTFQFIVATHSPAVIASITNAVVYDLRTRKQVLSDGFRGVRYGTLMTEHFGISSEIDLDSTAKLLKLRDLYRRAVRTPEEQRELEDLMTELSRRSQAMAAEVWLVKEGLSGKLPASAGERP